VAPGGSSANQVLIRNGFDFETNNSGLGRYTRAVVRTADVFGGAHGTAYMTVNPTLRTTSPNTNQNMITEVSINFQQEQRYFGLWWSAGDPHNVLEFFRHNQLVFDFTTAKVLNFIETHPTIAGHNRAEYFGNPNPQFILQVAPVVTLGNPTHFSISLPTPSTPTRRSIRLFLRMMRRQALRTTIIRSP
jgi:hypothetical protein